MEAGSFSLVRGLRAKSIKAAIELRLVLLGICVRTNISTYTYEYARTSSASASRPTVAKMVGSEKLPNLSRQDFLAAICRRFLNIAIFAEFKNRRIDVLTLDFEDKEARNERRRRFPQRECEKGSQQAVIHLLWRSAGG